MEATRGKWGEREVEQVRGRPGRGHARRVRRGR
jgi:hypothetical protein